MPDNHTKVPYRGKPAEECPDGPRYKAIGNSMAVPVMRWIGERVQMVDELLDEEIDEEVEEETQDVFVPEIPEDDDEDVDSVIIEEIQETEEVIEESDEEDDLFGFGNGTQLLHDDLAFLLGGQRPHDGGLDHGNQSHVAVGGHGDGAQQMGRQLAGEEELRNDLRSYAVKKRTGRQTGIDISRERIHWVVCLKP